MNTLSSLLNFIGNYIGKVETVTPSLKPSAYFSIHKVGRVVTIIVTDINNLPTAKASNAVATLPQGWRPPVNFFHLITDPNMNRVFRLQVTTAGAVNIHNYMDTAVSSSTNATGIATYVATR